MATNRIPSAMPAPFLAGLCLIACNTYDPSLLLPAQADSADDGPSPLGAAGGSGGSPGTPASSSSAPASGAAGGAPGVAPSAEPSGEGGGAGSAGAGGTAGSGSGDPVDVGGAGGAAGEMSDDGGAGEGGMGGSVGSAAGSGGGDVGGAAGAAGGGAGGAMAGGGAGGAIAGGAGGAGLDACTGCARLSVPLEASGDKARFVLTLEAPTDLSTAAISFRLRRVQAIGGTFRGYVQQGADDDFQFLAGADTPLEDIGRSLENVVLELAPVSAAFDVTAIPRIGIEISAFGSMSWSSPTIVDVDIVEISGVTPSILPWTFDSEESVHTTPVDTFDAGPMWLNSSSGDTTATGASVSWVGAE